MKKYILTSLILLLAGVNSAWGQNVAKIGNTEYATLAAAIAAVPTDGTETTITMLNDVDISEGVEISGNKNVTLNLNGKEIKMNVATNVAVAVFNVTGTANLTVTDTPSGGKITAHNDNKKVTAVIENNGSGKVTVAGGTLSTSTNAKWGVAILVKSGSAEVSGGSVTGDYYGIRNYGSGTITVSGGTVSGVYGIHNDGNASTINISGGTVTASGHALFNAEGKSCTIEVSGGQFSDPVPEEFCAPGYIPTETSTGVYSVGGPYVASITANDVTTGYATLAEAITAAQEGQTIVLLDNITGVNSPITINKTLTLDLNGKTLSGSADDMITVTAGSLTIDDTSTNHDGSISTTEKTAINFAGTKLTINNGTVEAVTADMYSGAMTVFASAGAVEVNGGTVRGQSTSAYASARAIHMEGTSTSLTVNGGTIEAQCAASYGYAYALECTSSSNVAVVVTDGTINATTGGSRPPVIINNTSANSTVAVSGGTFNQPIPAKQCAPGYIPTETSAGVYSVGGPYVASITANNVTTGYVSLAEAITAAQAGQTISLLDDITLTGIVTINKGITIDGGNHTVTKADGVAFELTGSNDVTFTNLKIDVTGASGRAIQAGTDSESYSGSLTVTNSTLTAGQRGVSVYEPGGNINLAISNTTIQSAVADPTTTYNPNDSRGVALWSYDGQSHNVTLENTTIKGFSYCINVGGTGKINDLTMTGGSTFGRAAINNHGKNGTFNLTNVEIHGLNNQTGPTEAFACILDDTDAAKNTYNLDNCTIIATLSDAAVSASNSNASEYLVDLRGKDSDIFITNGSTFTSNNADRSGLIEDYGRLDTNKGNTINFDAATYAAFDAVYDFANVEGLNTTGNSLTYTEEVYYYWTGQQAGGKYCSFAAPFTEGWLDNGEFIQLQRDVTLTSDITWQKGDGNSFYLELNGHSLSRDANALVPTYIYLNEGVTVYTDAEIDGLLLGLNNCPIAKFANTDATYKYKYTVVAEGSIAHINGTLYPSLAAAVAAAQDGDVITMIADDYASLTSGQEITINKSITITGPVDSDGMPLCIINGTSNNANYNDLFIKCTTGTVTISNVAFDGFGNDIASVIGQAPISVSTQNKKVVLDNVWISNINCEGVHINGGEFEITNCVIDCDKETEFDDYTKGICVVNEATGSITDTKIENVTNEITSSAMAGIELQGKGPITISDCEISTNDAGMCIGICADSAEDYQLGESSVTVSNTTVTSPYYTVYGNGTNGALITISSGTYNGALLAVAGNDSQGLSISGGTFNAAVPEEYCAPGYIPTELDPATGMYTVKSGEYVAQIGDTKYETLAAAIAAVPTDGTETTVTLLANITLTDNVVVGGTYGTSPKITTAVTNQNVKLDLNNHNITGAKTLYLAGGSLNITGTGTIESTSQDVAPVGVRYVKTAANAGLDYTSKRTLTIGSNVTLRGAEYGLNIFGTNEATTVNKIDVNVNGKVEGMLYVLGNLTNADNEININVNGTVDASAVTGTNESVHTGIALCGNASVNVNDGAIVKGESGIEVRAGQLNVSGGTITATSADYSYTANNNGTTSKGAAIAVAQHGTSVPISVELNGGSLVGTKLIAVKDAQNNNLSGVSVMASENFVTNTETVLPDGYVWEEATTGIYTIAPVVAQIGDAKYTTLAAAIAAVPTDGTATTITLLKDITLTERLFVNAGATPAYAGSNNRYATTTENKNITLELDGHNIVSSSNIALAGGSLNITNNGTADATHGVISTTAGGLAPIEVRGTGDLTSKRTLTIGTGVTLSSSEYGLNIFGSNDQQKNIIDVNVNGTVNGMLFVLGNLKNADNEININVNGTVDASVVTGTDEAVHTGIALSGNANVIVAAGATVKGESGIEVRAGSLTVNGGTITATSADYSYAGNGNGMSTKGAAVAVAQHGTLGTINVMLAGGTLSGTKKIAVNDAQGNNLSDVRVIVNNSFLTNSTTDTEIPVGFIWIDNGNNTSTLALAVARIGDVSYASLAEAFEAVEDAEVITLLKDVTLNADITCTNNGTFTLDFNGHSITNGNYRIKLTKDQAVLTNVETQIFAAADTENYVVTQIASGNNTYPYKYIAAKLLNSSGITVTVANVIYDGLYHGADGENPVKVTVFDANTNVNRVLVAGTDYTVSMIPKTNYSAADFGGSTDNVYKFARTYSDAIIIEGKPEGGYVGQCIENLVISPRNINDVNVEGHSQPYTAAGYTADDNETTGIKKLVTLKYNNIPLVVTTDYTIDVDATKTYKESGTYPEVITLTAVEGGNFTGSRKMNFYISVGGAKNITTSNITATVVYNGSAQVPTGEGTNPTLVVKDASTNTALTQGTDYTLEYITTNEYINAQTYSNAVTITGMGDYYGTKTVDYIITPKSITDCIINNSTMFTGSVITPATVVTVKDGNTTLSSDDYTLTVSNGYTYQNPQTYANAITITGKGNYTGTKTVDFIITQTDAIDLASAAVVISKQTYTGADLKPTAATTTVTVNGAALDPANYTFSFVPEGDNFYKDAKIYSNAIIITGKGGTYYGTAVGNYIIEPRDMNDGITVTTTNLSYLNTEQNITVEVKYGDNVIDETNYTFTPTKIFEAGHYDVTVTAVENSNLVGSTTADQWVFKSLEGDYADDFTVEPDPIPTQNYTGQEICPTIIVKDKDRVMTIADATSGDYSITYSNNIDPGEATITISGTYAYSGTITKTFKIITEYFVEGDFTYHHAQDGEEVSIGKKENGNNVLATTATGKVTVPETITHEGNTFTVTGIEENALGSPDITGITLPASIADVADNAFNGADNLRYIDLSTATAFVPSTLQRNIAASPFNGVPKQTLIYLNGTTFQGENYVYKPGSGNQYFCEKFTIYDDLNGSQTGFDNKDYQWAFENPHQFTAYTIENTRMLSASKHYTICLPYSIAIPAGTKAYTLDATSSQLFGFQEVTGTLAAFTPYVLIPTKSGQQLSATNTVVPAFEDDADGSESKLNGTTKGTFTLYGTMRYMDGDDATGKYIMQYNGGNPTWKQITSSPGFNNNPNKACILPMRAYIINNTSGSREYMGFSFTNLDGSTTIYNIDDMMFDSEDAIYDLKGRKVQNVLHGPYIINGKKILVK